MSISVKNKSDKDQTSQGEEIVGASNLSRVVGNKPYLPQVNLLPPSIVAKRALQRLKRLLLLVVILVVVIAIGLYAWAAFDAQSAKSSLKGAQAENSRLLQEQAKYSEVPKVLKQISLVENARVVGMGAEVAWSGYIAAVTKALPKDAVLQSMRATIESPVAEAPTPDDPLQTQGLGTITLVHRSPTVPDAAQWLDALSAIPGFVDPLYSTAVANDDDNSSYYEVTTTVQLTEDALSGRFLTQEDAK